MQKSFIKQNKLAKLSLPIFLLLSLQYQHTNQGRVHPGQTSTLQYTYDPPEKEQPSGNKPTKFSTGTSSSKKPINQFQNQPQNQSGQGNNNNNSQLPQSTNQSNSVNTTISDNSTIPDNTTFPNSTGEIPNDQNATDTTLLFPQTPILYTNKTFSSELFCHDCLLSGYGLCFDNSGSAFSNLDFASIVTEADLPPHVCCQSNDPESCPQIQDASWFCTFGYDLNSAMNICPFNPEVCGESRELFLNLTTSDQFIVPADIPADTICYYQVTADCGIGQFVSTDIAKNYEYAISYFMNYTYADAEQYPNLAQYIYPNAPDFCNIIGANVGVISRENSTVEFNSTIITDQEPVGNEPIENQPIENEPVDNTNQEEEQQLPEGGDGTPIVGQQIGGEDTEQEPNEGEEQQQPDGEGEEQIPDGEGQEQIPDETTGEQTEQEGEGQEQVPDQETPDQEQEENTDEGGDDVTEQITDYLNYWREILQQFQNQLAQQQAEEDQEQPDSGTIENPDNTEQTEEQQEQPQEEEEQQEQPEQQIEENTETSGDQSQEEQQIPDQTEEQNAETGETPTIMPASGGRRRLAQVDDEFLQIFNEKEFDEDDENIFYKTFKDEAQDVLDYGKQIYQTIEEKFNEIFETVQNYTQETFDI